MSNFCIFVAFLHKLYLVQREEKVPQPPLTKQYYGWLMFNCLSSAV